MKRLCCLFFCFSAAIALPGCLLAPRTELNAANSQSRALAEQNRAQLAEIENLKSHSRNLEDRVISSEEQLALSQERSAADRRLLDDYRRERDGIYR
jgi:hypothetical protein